MNTAVILLFSKKWAPDLTAEDNILPTGSESLCLEFGLLFYLMTSGLSKDVRCRVTIIFVYACKSPDQDIRPHLKWIVNLVIADNHLIFLRDLRLYMYGLTYSLYHLRV